MRFHCPLCGEELKVTPKIEKVDTEGLNDWSRSMVYVSFVSQSVEHACPKKDEEE